MSTLRPLLSCLEAARPFPRRAYTSSAQWKARQARDPYARDARVQGLKSRAAFKLLEMNEKYHLFKKGQTVVDLGYAPGSWSQVAFELTRPNGRVVGIDLLPAQPPRGVASFQGDFLSPSVRRLVTNFLIQSHRQSLKDRASSPDHNSTSQDSSNTFIAQSSYIDRERHLDQESPTEADSQTIPIVDIVLSDMSAPWEPTSGFSSYSLSNPYRRLMNTSGNNIRDHTGSMTLCNAALDFANQMLRPGGHFICKYYQGSSDKLLETRLKKLFAKVHRDKPEASRSESKEAFFVALRRKDGVLLEPEAP
ncbi:hypothetical protein CDD82_2577 [Ophiocordyceps australis]|uniref:rRNA methyltransferase 2, mitochondrial n=1 Tax=Ophiocordyceps australis TaxID=1399860 RepID=A0A2C5YM25_9HYPO|nr:hypothetical protein CDD82_2577 [Ophiocordyceps australis]